MKLLRMSHAHLHKVERMVEDAAAGLDKLTKTLVERTPSSTDSPSSTCSAGNNDPICQKPTTAGNSQTLAIILGVVIPLSCAIIVLIFLHRRHLKKQRLEDLNDPHKSLDFGMEGVVSSKSKGRKGMPEMTVTELGGHKPGRPGRPGRGLSMDMGMGSPYLLPAGLHGSRESLHSMARSQHDENDPYRPVTMLRPGGDGDSIRSGRLRDDKGSLYSASTGPHTNGEKAGLLSNARPMSQSFARRGDSMSPHDSLASSNGPTRPLHSANRSVPQSRKSSLSSEKPLPDINVMPMEPFPSIAMPEPAAQALPPRKSSSAAQQQFPPRKQSMGAQSAARSVRQSAQSSNYGDEPPMPPSKNAEQPYDINPAMIYSGRFSIDEPAHVATATAPVQSLHAPAPVAGNRLSVMGVRPLPPDIPEDNPEQRANRIRSFYKEYFDDSRPNPAYAKYEEDIDPSFLDAAVYDPSSGGFFMGGGAPRPFAQPVGRRAMTPPPRGPPRSNASSAMGQRHQRKHSTQSTGRLGPRGRAQSAPKKKLSPPMPLHSLPTPHALRGDIEVFSPIDFAPPSSFRQMQNGSRPDTPTGIDRPYSPSVRAFTPLASSFDLLSAMPSPHELRKSGTFTALDFAPPSKIRDPAMLSPGGSDAGSIRSNRSGISNVQSEAIRNGAYRVSRIPKGMVTTKDDLAAQLRPTMDMISRA